MDSKVVRADFGSGLICPRTHTCCALKSSAPSGARQDNYADSVSACKLAGVQIIPLPTLANQILARTFFRSVALQLACPAVEKFCRASSAGGRRHLQLNFVNQIVSVAEDCLSPAGSFHGCSLMHFRGCIARLYCAAVLRGCIAWLYCVAVLRGCIARHINQRKTAPC